MIYARFYKVKSVSSMDLRDGLVHNTMQGNLAHETVNQVVLRGTNDAVRGSCYSIRVMFVMDPKDGLADAVAAPSPSVRQMLFSCAP